MEISAINISPDIIKTTIAEVIFNQTGQTDNQPVQQSNPGLPENKKNGQVSEEQIRKAVDKANDSLAEHSIRLDFTIHDKTKEMMVKVVDENTGEIIRQIPTEKALDRLAMVLKEIGWLVDEKV